jgi:16S rRNA (uracil1498-N3)-methyltransferase
MPPEIAGPQPLKSAIELEADLRIVLAESERALTLKVALTGNLKLETGNSLTLAIGPEGGWTADELSAFATAGWTSASLSNTILRAETAAIAALAIAFSEIADK